MGSNPSPSVLFVSVIACTENAGVECVGDNGGNVGSLDGTLCGVFLVMSADVGVVEGVACCLNVHCEGVCALLCLPVVNHGVDCIDKTMLGNRVEESHQVVVGGVQ